MGLKKIDIFKILNLNLFQILCVGGSKKFIFLKSWIRTYAKHSVVWVDQKKFIFSKFWIWTHVKHSVLVDQKNYIFKILNLNSCQPPCISGLKTSFRSQFCQTSIQMICKELFVLKNKFWIFSPKTDEKRIIFDFHFSKPWNVFNCHILGTAAEYDRIENPERHLQSSDSHT